MLRAGKLQKIKNYLFQTSEGIDLFNTYAIVDAARSNLIYPKIKNADIKSSCLFHGKKAVDLGKVAPYLVQLEPDNNFTDWLLEKGWGNSWGIFIEAPIELDKLKRHFQKFLMVYDEDGNPLFFRFYDPRVFRVYLPTCNETELKTVYGMIKRYLLEGAVTNTLVDYSCTKEFRLIESVVEL